VSCARRSEKITFQGNIVLLYHFLVMVPSQVLIFFSCLSSSLNQRDVTLFASVKNLRVPSS